MKYCKIVLLIMIAFLITGCGKKVNKKCVLISDQSDNGYKSIVEYKIFSKGDIVTKVEQKEVIESEKQDILNFFQKEYNSQYQKYQNLYGGYKYKVNIKDKKLTLNVTINYKKFDMNKYLKDNTGVKKFVNKNNKYTVKGILKMYKNMGATCD